MPDTAHGPRWLPPRRWSAGPGRERTTRPADRRGARCEAPVSAARVVVVDATQPAARRALTGPGLRTELPPSPGGGCSAAAGTTGRWSRHNQPRRRPAATGLANRRENPSRTPPCAAIEGLHQFRVDCFDAQWSCVSKCRLRTRLWRVGRAEFVRVPMAALGAAREAVPPLLVRRRCRHQEPPSLSSGRARQPRGLNARRGARH